MATTSRVYTGQSVGEGNEGIISRRVFPVNTAESESSLSRISGQAVLYDVLVEAQFSREDGPDIWSVQIPGAEDADAFELPMHNWDNTDLDPYEGQVRFEEIARSVEERLGRTGLTILVS